MIAAAATALAFALPATAQAFSGPWDRAHAPRTITNQNVIVAVPDGQLAIMILPGEGCFLGGPGTVSGPVTVTITTPDASTIGTLKNPCKGVWTTAVKRSSPYLDVSTVNRNPVSFPAAEISADPTYNRWEPLLFTVIDARGVIAQGTYMTITSDTAHTRTIDQWGSPDDFFNICIGQNLPLYSYNGGDLACDYTTGSAATITKRGGWPSPPAPTMGLAEALGLMKDVILFISTGTPQQVTVTPCTHIGRLMWSCETSWRDKTFDYHGTLWVSEKHPWAVSYNYGYDLERTRLRCARNCTRHIS
jgi:hypothetical protein